MTTSTSRRVLFLGDDQIRKGNRAAPADGAGGTFSFYVWSLVLVLAFDAGLVPDVCVCLPWISFLFLLLVSWSWTWLVLMAWSWTRMVMLAVYLRTPKARCRFAPPRRQAFRCVGEDWAVTPHFITMRA